MRKIGITLVSSTGLACASGAVLAQEGGEPAAPVNLCTHAMVREGVHLDQKTRPIRELIGIAKNPTGFVIRQVSEHVVHIPPWVKYAVDPRGAIRAKAIDLVRTEMKKSLGIANDCREEAADAEPGDYSAMT